MVRLRRLELPRVLPHNDLNVTRIPIPPQPQINISNLPMVLNDLTQLQTLPDRDLDRLLTH